MIKYERLKSQGLATSNSTIDVLQSKGWKVIGEVVAGDCVFVKLTKEDVKCSPETQELE